MGPPTDDAAWDTNGVDGTLRFLDRVWRIVTETDRFDEAADASELVTEAHRAIHKVTGDIERFHFNTAVPPLMTLSNALFEKAKSGIPLAAFKEVVEILIRLLSPMAPHIAHELWERIGHDTMLALEPWPVADPALMVRSTVTMVIQVNGKLRDRVDVDADIDADEAQRLALESEKVDQWIGGHEIKRVIVREPNLVNIVVG
jgi:leucyl-tRNA synthetase